MKNNFLAIFSLTLAAFLSTSAYSGSTYAQSYNKSNGTGAQGYSSSGSNSSGSNSFGSNSFGSNSSVDGGYGYEGKTPPDNGGTGTNGTGGTLN